VALVVFGLLAIGIAVVGWRTRHRRARPGPGATGAVYDLLNQDKRRAIEMIVEQRAEACDPETADDIPAER
jgi:hypothetical protein